MQTSQYKYLKFVRFRDFFQWDLKRYFNQSIRSKFQIFNLGILISEEKDKFDVSDPKTDYGILGVNNQTGIFDAYIENGSKIKQKYKKMEVGWIAYNPYRVNVGSVGIKRECHKYTYISPAYVVFSCKQSLDPGFLYLALKTPLFNRVIRENTTGSVRQNLSFEVLKNLPIPLPSLSEQQALVETYNAQINAAEEKEQFAEQLNKKIEDYLLDELGIKLKGTYSQNLPESSVCAESQVEYCINPTPSVAIKDTTTYHWGDEIKKEYRWLKFVRFKDIDRWDCYNIENVVFTAIKNSYYPAVEIGKVFDFIKRSWGKEEKTFRYVELSSVDTLHGIMNAEQIDTSKAPSRATQKIKAEDLIIGTTRPYLKKFAIVNTKYDDCVCSSGFQVVSPSQKYNLYFLYEYLLSQAAVSQFEFYKTGALYPAITNADLRKILIPLPPLEIQNTIVKHITGLKEQIKQLKQEAKELRENALVEFEKEIFEN